MVWMRSAANCSIEEYTRTAGAAVVTTVTRSVSCSHCQLDEAPRSLASAPSSLCRRQVRWMMAAAPFFRARVYRKSPRAR